MIIAFACHIFQLLIERDAESAVDSFYNRIIAMDQQDLNRRDRGGGSAIRSNTGHSHIAIMVNGGTVTGHHQSQQRWNEASEDGMSG